jgi:hypothetical protein
MVREMRGEMKRKSRSLIQKALVVLALTALSVIGLCTGIIAQQKAEGRSDLITTHDAFVRSLISARVPGGVVTTSNCSQEAKLQTDILALPLFESLNRITQADPQYKWEVERGVINLIPRAREPEVLKIRIREFRVKNSPSLDLILEQLLALQEVKSDPNGRRVNQGLRYGGLSSPSQVQQLRLSVRNATLREALNAIVRAHGRAVWAYAESHCNAQDRFTIDFLVQ